VGTLLSAVNQGQIVLAGEGDSGTWIRIAVNYVVPYTVASIGFLSARRVAGCVPPDLPDDGRKQPGAPPDPRDRGCRLRDRSQRPGSSRASHRVSLCTSPLTRRTGGTRVDRPVAATARVEVLWRPGCPYCSRLRSGLRRAGISTVEHDIWADPAAAARVRAATGGDETVPTVVIGSRALVNPSVREVVAAVRTEFPDEAEGLVGAPSVPWSAPAAVWTPVLWTGAAAVGWIALAVWRPTTTWHLAPLLLAAAAPWVVGQDQRAGDRRGLPRVAAAALAGVLVGVLLTVVLAAAGLLRGPTIPGFSDSRTESLVLAGAGAVLAGLVGVRTALRRAPTTRSAWVGEHLLARSDDVVMVEGNAYFPASAIQHGALVPTSTRTICPWKGVARYYTVAVGGSELRDAAWSYAHPLPLARRVKRRIAFWDAVEIRLH
jgi:uncharacterized protein (DUF427 family)/glutaredoxin